MFDTLKIDNETKIIGRNLHTEKGKIYEKYNFIIENSDEISSFIKNLKIGKEVKNTYENPNFMLTIVKNHKEIGSWTINPNFGNVMTHDGHTYEFDLNKILNLNAKYPFNYIYNIKEFKNENEYDNYLVKQRSKQNFIFAYKPVFKYEGSFEIEFPKNSDFPHPKAVNDFLKPFIEKIVGKDDYLLGYELSAKNLNNRNQYTMIIRGSKKLFQELKLGKLKNENWKPYVGNAYFFYRK